MHHKKKEKKAKEASNKAIMISVTEEMAQPRMTLSARIANDKRIHASDVKPAWCKIPPATL